MANITELKNQYPSIRLPMTLFFNAYVIIWWLEVGKRVSFLGNIRIEFISGAILAFVAFLRYTSGNHSAKYHSLIPHAILMYLFILTVSLPLAIDFDLSWKTFIDKNIKFAMMSFFISQFALSPRYLAYFLLSSFIALMKVGQECFVGKITGSMVWENQGIPRLHGSPGTMFGHPNSLSGKFVSFLPFLWYVYPVIQSKLMKILIGVQLIFSINIIIFTGSRTGYVTFIAMCVLIFFKSRYKLRIFLFFCVAGMVLVINLPDHYKARFLSSFSGKEAEGQSKDARITLFKDSLTVFINHPLGVGLYCFPVAQERADRRAQETHNLYTQLLAETGIQGFLFFISLLYVIHKELKRIQNGLRLCIESLGNFTSGADENMDRLVSMEVKSNTFMIAVSNALLLFMYVRLVLGCFGHDLFEIYWWVMAGCTMSLLKMLSIAEARVAEIELLAGTGEVK
ncbi:O-antigen ligase family protein [Desulfocicer niacini]